MSPLPYALYFQSRRRKRLKWSPSLILDPAYDGAEVYSVDNAPFRKRLLDFINYHKAVLFSVSVLRLACGPSYVSRLISHIIINPVYAVFVLWLGAWPKDGGDIIPKWNKLTPFLAHHNASIKISVRLLVIWAASRPHSNPSGVEIGLLFGVLALSVFCEPRPGAFNFPAPAALYYFQMVSLVVFRLSALAKTLPYRVSFRVESGKTNDGEVVKFLTQVAFNVRRYFHSCINCGSPQIVNVYA